MKIIITEEQYKTLVTNLLDTLIGKITIKTVEEKIEDDIKEDYHSVFDEDGNQVMSIWVKGPLRNKGCKKDLTLESDLNEKFEKYMPYYRHKIFSKVLVDYIYDKLGIKCDCVQYEYNFKEEKLYQDGNEYEHKTSKTRRYNVKKKKKIKESIEDSNVVEQIMDMSGVKYDGCGYGGRTYDNFGRRHDTVEVYFKLPDEEKLYSRRIHFFTRNNKVVSVDSTGDFRTITDGFRYIPTDVLMSYFIEKAKTYIEKLLPKLYPNDSI